MDCAIRKHEGKLISTVVFVEYQILVLLEFKQIENTWTQTLWTRGVAFFKINFQESNVTP